MIITIFASCCFIAFCSSCTIRFASWYTVNVLHEIIPDRIFFASNPYCCAKSTHWYKSELLAPSINNTLESRPPYLRGSWALTHNRSIIFWAWIPAIHIFWLVVIKCKIESNLSISNVSFGICDAFWNTILGALILCSILRCCNESLKRVPQNGQGSTLFPGKISESNSLRTLLQCSQ